MGLSLLRSLSFRTLHPTLCPDEGTIRCITSMTLWSLRGVSKSREETPPVCDAWFESLSLIEEGRA
jgi:hypothetical protein